MKTSQYFAPSIGRRGLVAALFIFIFILISTFSSLNRLDGYIQYELPFGLGSAVSDQDGLHNLSLCAAEYEYLRRVEYGLSKKILFRKQSFRAVWDDEIDRAAVADVESPLLGEGRVLNLDETCPGEQSEETYVEPCEPITLKVPRPFPKTDFSDIVFGVATSQSRLQDSMAQLSHWLAGTGGQLLAVLVDENITDDALASLTSQFSHRGVDLLPVRPWNDSLNVNEQHFAIVRDFLHHSAPERKWAVIIDDDTFFPSSYAISKTLLAHDPKVPAYLGGLSENLEAVDFHGFMAFGGAGVFLSRPLLEELDPKVDECLEEISIREGDGLLKHCIYNKTDTKLTIIPGLHQFDMGGDLSGFYESGQFPLSLHHWKSWHHAPVGKMAKVVDFCGECFLQRWRFGNDTVLANGYSISFYEDGIEQADLALMEATWDSARQFEESMGPMRERVDDGRKKSYRLIDAEKVGKNLRQVYVYRAPEPSTDGDAGEAEAEEKEKEERMDEVVEIWWEWPHTWF